MQSIDSSVRALSKSTVPENDNKTETCLRPQRITGFLIALILVFHSSVLVAGNSQCDEASALVELEDGIFVRQGVHGIPFEVENLANIGFIVGERCVAAIDSGASVKEGDAMRCALERVTTLPICYLVLTHHHFDHVMGSKSFRRSNQGYKTEIIGHEKLESALRQSAQYYLTNLSLDPDKSLSADHIVIPDVVVKTDDTMTIDLGGRQLELFAHSTAHTDNDLSILDTKTNTLWLSDLLFVEHVPALDSSLGSINGWLEALDELKATSATKAITGHGPVSVDWPRGAEESYNYLSTVRDEIREIIAENGSLKRAEAEVGISEQSKWQMFDYHHQRTVIRAFTELEWE